jgi:16S rRNA processing protein RimM
VNNDALLVGRVARAHGNRGQVIVNPETDFAGERFKVGQVVLVGAPDRAASKRITAVRFHQGRPIVALEGVATMNDAEALAGAGLWMAADDIPPLPANMFYRHDLVGCEVRDANGAVVGRVRAVDGTIDRSLLVVDGERGEVLIPMTADICVNVDPVAGVIVVNPPAGLLDVNAREAEDRRTAK